MSLKEVIGDWKKLIQKEREDIINILRNFDLSGPLEGESIPF